MFPFVLSSRECIYCRQHSLNDGKSRVGDRNGSNAMQSIRRVDSSFVIWLLPAVTFPDIIFRSSGLPHATNAHHCQLVPERVPPSLSRLITNNIYSSRLFFSHEIACVPVRVVFLDLFFSCVFFCFAPSPLMSRCFYFIFIEFGENVTIYDADWIDGRKMASLLRKQIITHRSINCRLRTKLIRFRWCCQD